MVFSHHYILLLILLDSLSVRSEFARFYSIVITVVPGSRLIYRQYLLYSSQFTRPPKMSSSPPRYDISWRGLLFCSGSSAASFIQQSNVNRMPGRVVGVAEVSRIP